MTGKIHPAVTIVGSVCDDFDGGGIASIGASAALKAMLYHWKDHLAQGHNHGIISVDIDSIKDQLEIMRAEIMRRILVLSTSAATQEPSDPKEKQRKLLAHFGYTIQSHNIGLPVEGWWALLPGETEFKDDGGDPPKQNYLGFFSSEADLLNEISADLEVTRSDQIKAEYLASGFQRINTDEAIKRLLTECESLFENEGAAWEFLMEEPQYDD